MQTTEKRPAIKRWIVLILIIAGGVFAFGIPSLKPISPAVVLPGEVVFRVTGLPITNTLAATFVADIVLLAIAFGAQRFSRSGNLVPQGFYNFFEFVVEFLWNTTEGAAGRWARRMFPWIATIFLLVLTANMVKLIPGFESIGLLHPAEGSHKGYAPLPLFGNVYFLDAAQEVPQTDGEASAEGEHSGRCASCEVVPFLRGSATDLNFTFALAAIAVVMIQVFGVRALGLSYFTKFFNVRTMFTVPMFGVIDFGVGLLELVSEFAKILSFGFRLFGNIFAGALLISILGALTAVIIPTGLYLLEVFVGLIQAYVFAMLTLVFMSQATVGHGADEHSGGH